MWNKVQVYEVKRNTNYVRNTKYAETIPPTASVFKVINSYSVILQAVERSNQ